MYTLVPLKGCPVYHIIIWCMYIENNKISMLFVTYCTRKSVRKSTDSEVWGRVRREGESG